MIYPVCFSNEQRIVQIKGEAYFDVAPDSEHPFIVQTPYTSIQVTGTTFNVRAYPDENIESTTLINGSIKIKSKNEDFELTPNQHFIFDKNSKKKYCNQCKYRIIHILGIRFIHIQKYPS